MTLRPFLSKIKRLVPLVSIPLLGAVPSRGEEPTVSPATTYSLPGCSLSNHTTLFTNDGGAVILGTAACDDDFDIAILKLRTDGSVSWQKTLGTSDWEFGQTIVQTSDSGFLVAANASPRGIASTRDGLIARLGASGDLLWSTRIGGPGFDWVRTILEAPDGGAVVGGYMNLDGGQRAWLFRLDSAGGLVWQKIFQSDRPWVESVSALVRTDDGGFVLAGKISSGRPSQVDFWFAKLGFDGLVGWQNTYRSDYLAEPLSIRQLPDRGFLVGGAQALSVLGPARRMALRLDPKGGLLWSRLYLGLDTDELFSGFAITSVDTGQDGSLLLLTDVLSPFTSAFHTDVALINIDREGIIRWQKAYGATGDEQATISSSLSFAGGGYLVAATSRSFGPRSSPWLLRVTSEGAAGDCFLTYDPEVRSQPAGLIRVQTTVAEGPAPTNARSVSLSSREMAVIEEAHCPMRTTATVTGGTGKPKLDLPLECHCFSPGFPFPVVCISTGCAGEM